MSYTIRYPRPGQPVRLSPRRYKFVACGEAPPGQRNFVGLLKRGDQIVASATPRREFEPSPGQPGQGRRFWVMVFNLEHLAGQIGTNPYKLALCQIQGSSGNLVTRAEQPGIQFSGATLIPPSPKAASRNEAEKELDANRQVDVIYPEPSAYCRYGFSPYGFTDAANITTVKLYTADLATVVATAYAPPPDTDGFWWATFDEVPEVNDLVLRVEASSGSPGEVENLDFVDC